MRLVEMGGQAGVMADHDHTGTLRLGLANQQANEVVFVALVQGRCGLVRNDQRRVPHEGPRCGHPLLLPHRQGVDRLMP